MSTFVGLSLWVASGCVQAIEEPCAPRTGGSRLTVDPRAWFEIGQFRACGLSREGNQVPDSADVVVWEVGEAAWAKTAAMHQSGAVVVARRTDNEWREQSRLRSPQPAAYGGFGAQLASDGRWLAVLAARVQRVWVFDLRNLDATPLEIEGVRGFAKTVAMLGDQVVVGGQGEARLYRKQTGWTLADRVVAPAEAAEVFSGQIVAKGDLIVSTNAGLKNGDGGALPGRVDVYRHGSAGWQWEGQLTPSGRTEPFGQDCCVSVDRGQVTVHMGEQRWRFMRDGASWTAEHGGTP